MFAQLLVVLALLVALLATVSEAWWGLGYGLGFGGWGFGGWGLGGWGFGYPFYGGLWGR